MPYDVINTYKNTKIFEIDSIKPTLVFILSHNSWHNQTFHDGLIN